MLSGIAIKASFSNKEDIGSKIITQIILNNEWHIAMPTIVALSSRIGKKIIDLTTQKTVNTTTVPITLNIKCTNAALLAFLLVPIEESKAVTHVPIFWPIIIGIAAP